MSDDETQLLNFCTASVDLYARSIIDPTSVNLEAVQKEIQSFVTKMDKKKATNIGKVLFCLELQYRNARLYECFMSTKKKIEDSTEGIRDIASAILSVDNGVTLNAIDLQRHAQTHSDLASLATSLLKFYSSCFPIRHRVRYAPTPLLISPICSYNLDGFEINAANEYLLLDKHDLMWKVQTRDKNNSTAGFGPQYSVPSLFFFINWLSDDAVSLQRLFTRAREALSSYIVALATYFRKLVQKSDLKSVFSVAELTQLNSLVLPIPEDPDNVTKQMVSALRDELTNFSQRTVHPELVDKSKLLETTLTTILSALNTYLAIPDSVPDRSKLVLNKRLRINGQEASESDEKLVQVEWKMQLILNKCMTTTETTEIIPKHVDIDRFKQSEQELERKMVIKAVVDPETDKEIGLNEAVSRGIVDYSTGRYCDHRKNESVTIDEAIIKGLIQVEFVAMKASEERAKSFGTITVEDAKTKVQTHYLVNEVLNRKTGERLDFDSAVDSKILNLENSTYWDSLESQQLSIADALEAGYLAGRKIDDLKEFEKKARTRTLTS